MHVLIICAHPDDAEIFCGGSIVAWQKMGMKVLVMIATDGSKGGRGEAEDLINQRRQEAQSAAVLLGHDLLFLGFVDGSLAYGSELAHKISSYIEDNRPALVITHSPNCYHADHRACAEAALAGVNFHAPLLYFDTMMGTGSLPNFYIDISKYQDLKEKSILCHRSQDPERFIEPARTHARARFAQATPIGTQGFAECFSFQARFPYADIRSLIPASPPLIGIVDRSALTPKI